MAGWDDSPAPAESGGGWDAGISAPDGADWNPSAYDEPGFKSGKSGFGGDDQAWETSGNADGADGGGGRSGGGCRICHEEGHFARACPNKPEETSCRYCKKEDHVIADCPTKPPRDDNCRICKQEGHMARECPDKPENFGACFNCGEQGHNKSECDKPRVFTGTCRICEKEGHSSKECPDRPADQCKNCNEEGHLAAACTNSRVVDMPHVQVRSCEDAWNDMEKASAEDEFDDFKEHMLEYLKAMRVDRTPIDLSDLEQAFRDNGFRYYIIALKHEATHDKVIVGPNGELDRKYSWALNRTLRPRRTKALAERVARTPEENLEWLKEAGTVCDELRPFCMTCKEKGHTSRTCDIEKDKDELPMVKCINCASLDHRMRDCPEPRKNFNACRNCGEEGHKSTECEKPRVADESTQCRKCNEMGHFSRDCPTAGGSSGICYNCGQEGHRSSDCTNERVMKCRNCDEFGHAAKECSKPRDVTRVKCNNCGEMGHFSRGCSNPAAEPAADESNRYNTVSNVGNDAPSWDSQTTTAWMTTGGSGDGAWGSGRGGDAW